MADSLRVRALNASYDTVWGTGQGAFLSDIDAVAQIIITTIRLLFAEFWSATNIGTPLFTEMLGIIGAGKHPDAMALILQQRILSVPYVQSISNVATNYDPNTRTFSFKCVVQTAFGQLTVSSQPGSFAALPNE